jgi:rhodanese-related sulfurtransferase/DNA-binding transcriptional ArsR family regulator
LFDGFAAIGKAVGSGRRIELLDLLAQAPCSVKQLASAIDQSVATTSAHLQTLAAAGLVTFNRQGNRLIYELTGPAVEDLLAALRIAAVEHADALGRLQRDYLGDRDSLQELSRAELADRLNAGEELVIFDVRPAAEFAAGHVPGARQVEPDDLAQMLRNLPPDVEVVAYCRGPFCVFADEAVRLLSRHGIRARRLQDGFPEWRRAGLRIAVSRHSDTPTGREASCATNPPRHRG